MTSKARLAFCEATREKLRAAGINVDDDEDVRLEQASRGQIGMSGLVFHLLVVSRESGNIILK